MLNLKNLIRLGAVSLSFFFVMSFMLKSNSITVFLVGDSTMSLKEKSAFPETGWGMPFESFFDSTVAIENHAKNGRSTRTFISEKRWQAVFEKIKEGDYVFIQFGHNDESKKKVERYTSIPDFKKNLALFVTGTRSKKGIPVLLTPVSRRYFDSTGHIKETHKGYTEAVKEVADSAKVPLIDLDGKSRELYQNMGNENSKLLFNWHNPQEHPNYPEGLSDDTHFNELGARKIAQIVLKEIQVLQLPLKERIVKGKKK